MPEQVYRIVKWKDATEEERANRRRLACFDDVHEILVPVFQPTQTHPNWWCAWRQHWRATPCLCEQHGSLNTGCGLVVPVEPVGTLTVRSNGTSHIDNLLDVPPGKYRLIPVEADDE